MNYILKKISLKHPILLILPPFVKRAIWSGIKPLKSNKNCAKINYIILTENDIVVNNSTDVSNLMNEYYVNITETIGYDDSIVRSDIFDDIVSTHVNDRSVLYIKDNIAPNKSMFCFVEPTHVRV